MDHLWAPWRSAHVTRAASGARTGRDSGTADDDGPSLFSRIAAEPEHDVENHVLHRGRNAFVLLNRYPYTSGHLMVVPHREVEAYDALTDDERDEMGALAAEAMRWLRLALAPDGFNVGINQGAAGGAGIPRHLHLHVVPRWHGDTNFMPAVGDVRVLPQALDDTYRALRAVQPPGAGPVDP